MCKWSQPSIISVSELHIFKVRSTQLLTYCQDGKSILMSKSLNHGLFLQYGFMFQLILVTLIGTSNCFYFVLGSAIVQLFTAANARVHSAMRPATRMAYSRHFRIFIMFCIVANFSLEDISVP